MGTGYHILDYRYSASMQGLSVFSNGGMTSAINSGYSLRERELDCPAGYLLHKSD
jgi:hypothetical protein